ncbi:hypothetical protein [Desulfolutivibrio sulfoxidireducens]|uniref:hypothetical protein n=1 Tax=Desulfolutivibrio sulfoxidireducens TaxID=2773299 RepID=UPI00159E3920|nr:hypothetical protein [Desulfolutivibrio sulfoxidireducens]QLA15804.1 hypothetical protein GD605_06415 [Desulfolutivibrio sulfoxidireducens]
MKQIILSVAVGAFVLGAGIGFAKSQPKYLKFVSIEVMDTERGEMHAFKDDKKVYWFLDAHTKKGSQLLNTLESDLFDTVGWCLQVNGNNIVDDLPLKDCLSQMPN